MRIEIKQSQFFTFLLYLDPFASLYCDLFITQSIALGYREQQHIEDQYQYDILHEKLLQLQYSHDANPTPHALFMSITNYLRIPRVIVHNHALNIDIYMIFQHVWCVYCSWS